MSSKHSSNCLKHWINSTYLTLERINDLQKKFRNNKPFEHLELKNFFKKEKITPLLNAVNREVFYEKQADLFHFKQTSDLACSYNPVIKQLRDFLKSKEFTEYLTKITRVHLFSNVLDMHGTLYQNTDYLLCHDDQLQGRKIAYLYYLSTLKKKQGGALTFFSSKKKIPEKITRRIIPVFNTFVLFKVSPVSFHAIEEVTADTKRVAITGWFHG